MTEVIAVTTCRNEVSTIRRTIESILSQTVPSFYVVVDDASTDGTWEIVKKYECDRLKPLRMKESGIKAWDSWMRMVCGFMQGFYYASRKVPEWRYLFKFDADVYLSPNYMETLIKKMEQHPKLGIASGLPYTRTDHKYERMKADYDYAADNARVYRRECWEEIGGLYPMVGFDTHASFKALQLGWQVRNFSDAVYYEERPFGRGRPSIKWWMKYGIARCRLGYPLRHHVLMSISRIRHHPPILGSLAILMAYMISRLALDRPFPKEYYDFVKEYMLNKTRGKLLSRFMVV